MLCQASKAGHVLVVDMLLRAGAEVAAAGWPARRSVNRPISPCVSSVQVEAAGTQYGTTSLLMASKSGHADVVRRLLAARANTEVAGRAYGTACVNGVSSQQHL